MSGFGRGGRGAALLKALESPVRRPGETVSGHNAKATHYMVFSKDDHFFVSFKFDVSQNALYLALYKQ